jgi:hypothetical protein
MQKLVFAAVSRNCFNIAVPNRVKSTADGYINRDYLNAARQDLAASLAGSPRC